MEATTYAVAFATAPVHPAPGPKLGLVNGFDLCVGGDAVDLPLQAQRLLAFLALHRRPLLRAHAAGRLWMETTEPQARANLRSTIWRIEHLGHGLIESTRTHLGLAPEVSVDVTEALDAARGLSGPSAGTQLVPRNLHLTFTAGELLPDWLDDEDWLLMERTRFHQVRLHALERLCHLLIDQGRVGEAVDAALAAVAADPLRESAHRAAISAYLAEGNAVEAIRQYDAFRALLAEEMGASPTRQMEDLMALVW